MQVDYDSVRPSGLGALDRAARYLRDHGYRKAMKNVRKLPYHALGFDSVDLVIANRQIIGAEEVR